jgi:hypothetical protein
LGVCRSEILIRGRVGVRIFFRGYVDNSDQSLFRISDAVTADGQPIRLDFIDFVKVQTAVNAKAGWLGEISTEVTKICDYNLLK